ncbi:MAG: ParB/RepB/Spo0J family partition protein [Phycisphaerae bacterium]|nr:ParB/RepB/Spo0J family partition protein [Phycisphaerae bacterium]
MMMSGKGDKPRHLGRGLESLLSPLSSFETLPPEQPQSSPAAANFPPDKELDASFHELPLDSIGPNPYQARTVWNEEDLLELTDSIRANGVIQPIIVRPFQGRYQLIAGERRFRAAQMAALPAIPAVVREVTDEQLFEWSLVENIHRRDLNAIERAKAYQRYLNAFSLTQADAAERLGEDRSVIANYLRLLDLPEDVRQMLVDGTLSMGHARAILGLPTDDLRRKLANRAMAGRLSVRDVERLVRKHLSESPSNDRGARAKPMHIRDLEDKLKRHLGARVAIETRRNGQRGRIVIEFDSIDEFARIAESLGLACTEDV